jgi:hypothetical protein
MFALVLDLNRVVDLVVRWLYGPKARRDMRGSQVTRAASRLGQYRQNARLYGAGPRFQESLQRAACLF